MIGMLIDVTRCTGCNQCVNACNQANNLGDNPVQPQYAPDGLSENRWSSIVQSPEGRFVRKMCRHCVEPACVSVCPAAAMVKTPEGPVIYDVSKCLGCRYCMMACPYGIPRYEWSSTAPQVKKCTFCFERLQDGLPPACQEACPEQALMFGSRDEMIAMAHQRIEANPGRYQPIVYGEEQAGGASVMYISDVPLDFLRTPVVNPIADTTPLPHLSANWLENVPLLSVGTAGLMTGLFYIIGRRMQFFEAAAARKEAQRRDNP